MSTPWNHRVRSSRLLAFYASLPFQYAPSQYWTGNDGTWSSFIVRIGTPAQDFQVFPSTAGQETIIPLPEGCTSASPSDCGSSRGVLPAFGVQGTGFLTNESSTWDLIGLYTSNLEDTLGYSVNAQYGFDTVGLQVENSGGLNVNKSIVAGVAETDFYIGVLGLGPKPSNFSTFSDPQRSFMKTLNATKRIPSLSYGYTAGAYYRYSKILGSLTLGGFDASRFEPTDLVIPFAGDDSRPLQVAIQSITGQSTLTGTTSLLPTPVFANIDSTLPYLWLPQAACDNFQTAFGLIYDNTTDLYTVNDTIHTQLTNLNPSVTFRLGNTLFDGTTQNIQFPYAAFDLEASYPIYTNATKYFPIRRAANDTQYTLGRAFLQEAYIVADYERNNFTVAQAKFSATMPESNIIAIYSLGHNSIANNSSTTSLTPGGIAGIVVGAIVGVALLLLAVLLYRRRRKRQLRGDAVSTIDPDTIDRKEMGDEGASTNELASDGARHELSTPGIQQTELQGDTAKWSSTGVQELHSDIPTPELSSGPLERPPKWIHEAEGSPGRVYELPGNEPERAIEQTDSEAATWTSHDRGRRRQRTVYS